MIKKEKLFLIYLIIFTGLINLMGCGDGGIQTPTPSPTPTHIIEWTSAGVVHWNYDYYSQGIVYFTIERDFKVTGASGEVEFTATLERPDKRDEVKSTSYVENGKEYRLIVYGSHSVAPSRYLVNYSVKISAGTATFETSIPVWSERGLPDPWPKPSIGSIKVKKIEIIKWPSKWVNASVRSIEPPPDSRIFPPNDVITVVVDYEVDSTYFDLINLSEGIYISLSFPLSVDERVSAILAGQTVRERVGTVTLQSEHLENKENWLNLEPGKSFSVSVAIGAQAKTGERHSKIVKRFYYTWK